MKPHVPTWLTVVVIVALVYWLFFRHKQDVIGGNGNSGAA